MWGKVLVCKCVGKGVSVSVWGKELVLVCGGKELVCGGGRC